MSKKSITTALISLFNTGFCDAKIVYYKDTDELELIGEIQRKQRKSIRVERHAVAQFVEDHPCFVKTLICTELQTLQARCWWKLTPNEAPILFFRIVELAVL